MYEAHFWCCLAATPEDVDDGGLEGVVAEISARVETMTWTAVSADLRRLNGQWVLTAACWTNRRRGEAVALDDLLEFVAERLPGSWGLAYDRDDQMPEPYGPNRFRVRVMARGSVTEADDPFLSPARPVIED
jgi:Immunity protein 7